MPQILAALYLTLMVAAGWRLFGMAWTRARKIAAAAALLVPIPLILLLPALLHPERPFADILRAVGFALLACGLIALAGGMTGAWLRARKR